MKSALAPGLRGHLGTTPVRHETDHRPTAGNPRENGHERAMTIQPASTGSGIQEAAVIPRSVRGYQAEAALLKTGALQNAIVNSANFPGIATDEKGVIQLFNVGAERMLGYTAAGVINKITPADISDPQELIARAEALSLELGTPITPGFEALVFKASHGIEDIYELTKIHKDGSRFPAIVSVTALRDEQDAVIGYLLIGTDNTARKQIEEERKKLDQRLRDQQFYTRSLLESSIDALMTRGVRLCWMPCRQIRPRLTRFSRACPQRRLAVTNSQPTPAGRGPYSNNSNPCWPATTLRRATCSMPTDRSCWL